MSISATSPSWNAVESASPSPNRSIAHSSSSHGSCPSNSTDSSPASRSSISSSTAGAHAASSSVFLRSSARPGRLAADQDAELVVCRAVAVRTEALAGAPTVEPGDDQPLDRLVELLGRHAAEHRAADRRHRAERAAQQDVVALVPLAFGVAHRRALEAEIADPVLAAGVGAAVEMEAELGDLVAEPPFEVLDQAAEPPLRLGDGEVAVRLAGAADRVRAQAVRVDREADRSPAPARRRRRR